jgi:hypothetical protein
VRAAWLQTRLQRGEHVRQQREALRAAPRQHPAAARAAREGRACALLAGAVKSTPPPAVARNDAAEDSTRVMPPPGLVSRSTVAGTRTQGGA